MSRPVVDILMYHSISATGGATCIDPVVFGEQMAAIARAGVPVITMDDYLAARRGDLQLEAYSIVITFDDGFRDFSTTAWPVLSDLNFRPIVYLPTGNMGRDESWEGAHTPPRQLMSWHEVHQLHREGVCFGSHTVSHANLNTVSPEIAEAELKTARQVLEDQLGNQVVHFAPPYGLAGKNMQQAIARHYQTSVGTRLASASLGGDVLDLPRLEMFYFTDQARWQAHLAGRGRAYLQVRKIARSVRQTVLNPWQ